MEEQGVAFGSDRDNEEGRRNEERRLKEEQDAAYLAALKLDQVSIRFTHTRVRFLDVSYSQLANQKERPNSAKEPIFCTNLVNRLEMLRELFFWRT